MFFEVLIKSLILGALAGFGTGAGAARMFHAPKVQGMGAFRTFGELNACEGDPVAHFSFGLSFFFGAWADNVGAGALGQEVNHRIIPNWSAAILLFRNKNVEETLYNPKKMAFVGSIVGAVVLAFLNTTAAAVPESMQTVATAVLTPAANWLLNPVMPVIFWLAAFDAGQRTGFWGTVFGGLAQAIMGNAVPGVVLGILLGKGVDDSGWNKVTKTMLASIITLFVLSAFFRGTDMTLLQQMGMEVPAWLTSIHEMF